MTSFNPGRFRKHNPSFGQEIPVHKANSKDKLGRFIKGPIPLPWIQRASKLPGKSLAVGLAIWYRSGLIRQKELSLPTTLLGQFGIDRHAKRRALSELENAGLIGVSRKHGKNPIIITILEVQ